MRPNPKTGLDIQYGEISDEDEFLKPQNPNKFVYNDQNGGRKKRIRNVSRINCLKFGEKNVMACKVNLFGVPKFDQVPHKKEATQDAEMNEVHLSPMNPQAQPINFDISFYHEPNETPFLPILSFDNAFNHNKNPISTDILATLLQQQS